MAAYVFPQHSYLALWTAPGGAMDCASLLLQLLLTAQPCYGSLQGFMTNRQLCINAVWSGDSLL